MNISPFLGTWIGISSDDKTEFCIKKDLRVVLQLKT